LAFLPVKNFEFWQTLKLKNGFIETAKGLGLVAFIPVFLSELLKTKKTKKELREGTEGG